MIMNSKTVSCSLMLQNVINAVTVSLIIYTEKLFDVAAKMAIVYHFIKTLPLFQF